MLVYGAEAVLPVEIELPNAHLAIVSHLEPFHRDCVLECIAALEYLDEYPNDDSNRLQCYQKRWPTSTTIGLLLGNLSWAALSCATRGMFEPIYCIESLPLIGSVPKSFTNMWEMDVIISSQ